MSAKIRKKAKQKKERLSPGARESNAGDDFHILWAMRRAVRLLDPSSELRRVLVEKVSPQDELRQKADEDLFLGVDLSEYYGGEEFQSATRVVATQLKYSTRQPSRRWTASRLCASDTNKSASIIKRLADVFKGYLAGPARVDVLAKLTIRLVSNQPLDDKLRVALESAQSVLQIHGVTQLPTRDLLMKLPAGPKKIIAALQSKAGLRSVEFADFLRVLDLSGCGEEARSFQRLRLIQELAPSVSASPVAALRNLRDLIEREARPEGSTSRGLIEADIVAALEVSHKDDLFPARSHLKLPENFIKTSDAQKLARTVVNATDQRVLAHGDAGVGKTTTVQSLITYLPAGSVVVTYDCYGGGNYLVMGEQRHTNNRAFMQLTNELALQCGTPFLIRPAREKYDLQRNFRRALDAADKIVSAQGGILVIVVDAADNAVIAAAVAREDDCFVPALWTTPLPERSRLLMTSRSHRRLSVKPPSDVIEYELKGFDAHASAQHLRLVFPDADSKSCKVFDERTSGNPRVQYYLLDRARSENKDKRSLDALLKTSKRTPNDLFADLLDAAVKHAPKPEDAKRLLAILLSLSRPVPLQVFADACAIKFNDGLNFCRALVPGLIIENEFVSFRDEDFETFLRSHVTETEAAVAHDRLATYFLPLSNADPYASRVVAEHLAQAGRHADVIALAVNGPEPLPIRDQMQRLQVTRRRLNLAMHANTLLGQGAEAVRLTLLAAEAARSDGAVTALVRENPELAACYGDAENVARLYTRPENNDWLGAAHLRAAAIYARNPAHRERAKEHMRQAEAWIRRWSTLPESQRHGWHITARDVAAGTETVFWLSGAVHARDWLRRWRPPSFVMKAVEKLGTSLAENYSPSQQEQDLIPLSLPGRVVACLLSAMWVGGGSPSRLLVEYAAKNLDRFLKREARILRRQERSPITEQKTLWAVPFCEVAASLGVKPRLTLRLIRSLCPRMPDTEPHRNYAEPYYDPLRAACLEAVLLGRDLSIDDVLPERFRHKKGEREERYASERRAFGDVIGNVLRVHVLRARTLVKPTRVSDIAEDLTGDLNLYREKSEHRWFKGDHQYSTWALKACETLLACSGDAENLFEEIAALAERTIPSGSAWLWKDMAEMLARHERYRSLAYRLLEQAALFVTERPVPARDRWELLLRCSEIASRYDETLGRDYYGRALSAAEGIDDDIVPLLSLETRLASRIIPLATDQERRGFATRLARNVEAHEKFVSERAQTIWEQALGAVTKLDFASGAALCTRWDDEDRLRIEDGIKPFIREATNTGRLLPLEALSLLRLTGDRGHVSKTFITILDRLNSGGVVARPELVHALRLLSVWITRDLPVSQRQEAAEQVVAWSERNGIAHLAGVSELRELISFASQLSSEENQQQSYSYHLSESEKATVDQLFLEARNGSLEDLDIRVDKIWRSSYRSKGVREFLVTLGRSVAPSQRVAYLDALIAVGPDRVYAQYIAEALGDLLIEWRNHADVRHWVAHGIPTFFENQLPAVVAYSYNAAENLNAVLEVPQLTNYPRDSILLPAVGKHMEALSARSLYVVAEAIAATLEDSTLREVFEWSLTRTEQRLEKNGAVLGTLAEVHLINEVPKVLAHFLWTLFGHSDKRVRWRALHAARGVLTSPSNISGEERRQQTLDELVGVINSSHAGTFRSKDLEFYPISARVWLLVLLERLADERPEKLAAHAGIIADIAIDRTFPHAQLRELAKRAAFHLAEHIPTILPHHMLDALMLANRPMSCLYPRGNAFSSRYGSESSDQTDDSRSTRRFGFDWLDTLRYWYPPVSRIFGDPPRDLNITARAERWICDHWGRSDKDWWKDPREIGARYSWQEMENGHGQVPIIENMRTYLEYHAMFCAAGEMADELPQNVRNGDYENSESLIEPWERWIREHVTTRQDCWLADLRSSTPYRADCWGHFVTLEQWLRRDNPAEYDFELGLEEGSQLTEMVVNGYMTIGDSMRRGTTRVSSALVSPDAALSLMRALQTTSNPHNYILPVDDEDYSEREITDAGFELNAWLNDGRFEEGLDQFDPFARGVSGSFVSFGKDFMNSMAVRPIAGTGRYRSANGSEVARFEIWDDSLEKDRITEPFSTGRRLWLRIDVLLEYLRRRNRDLIIEVQIARNSERSQRDEEEKYDLGKSRIYLLRGNGTLETLDRCRHIG